MPPPSSASPIAPEALLTALTGELTEPVADLSAALELLQRRHLSPELSACVETLADAARRIRRALGDVAELADGGAPLASDAFSPRQVMDELQARWTEPNGGPTVLLAAYEGDGELCARGDAARLGQVLDALIGRAAGRSRGAVEAALTARADGGRVRLTGRIRDDLRDAVDPERLFDLDGAGGGLALKAAAELIARMGGGLEARRNAGAGLSIVFQLDLPEATHTVDEPAEDEHHGPAMHVLIVDDNATNRLVAEAFCDMFGCTSDSAEDGVEAVEAVGLRAYDVILMDVKMPRMDGLQATRAIRAMTGPAASTPIVALTANADPEDIRRYLAAGMEGVVEKPIKADRLADVLNAVLEAREPARAGSRAAA